MNYTLKLWGKGESSLKTLLSGYFITTKEVIRYKLFTPLGFFDLFHFVLAFFRYFVTILKKTNTGPFMRITYARKSPRVPELFCLGLLWFVSRELMI